MPEEKPTDAPVPTPEVEPEKSARRWSWDAFFSGGLLGFITLCAGFLFLPLFPAGQRDPRRSEGEQMLGSMKGQARVEYAKSNGVKPLSLAGYTHPAEFEGQYYRVVPVISQSGPTDAALYAIPLFHGGAVLRHPFNWEGGSGSFEIVGIYRDAP